MSVESEFLTYPNRLPMPQSATGTPRMSANIGKAGELLVDIETDKVVLEFNTGRWCVDPHLV